MYPEFLQPTDIEPFSIESKIVNIPKCIVKFSKWKGTPVKETFGGKAIIEVDSKPMFAELAVMNYFLKNGWETRWVETYGKKKPIYLAEWKDDKYRNQIHVPFQIIQIENMLEKIAIKNANSYSGCWDIVSAKNGMILFAELKRTNKDKIRLTQSNWLSAGLKCGLNSDNFLVVQWELE